MKPLEPALAEAWMREALIEANNALQHQEVPVGAVVVNQSTGQIIARAHNRRVRDSDPTAHAEVLALRAAAGVVGDWRLEECVLVVTLEPCAMCAGAIVNARIPRLLFGCLDPKAGAVQSLMQLCSDPRLNHRVQIESGVLAAECATLLTEFFRERRQQRKSGAARTNP